MKKYWSLEEIILKLPLINIKLKAPQRTTSQVNADRLDIHAAIQGLKVGFRSFNGSFVGADINRNGELMANGPKMDTWETFEFFRLPDGKVALRACNGMFIDNWL